MEILIVGDKPSKKNKDPDIPFVGTKSYKTLLEWLYKMNVDISDVCMTNTNQVSFRGPWNSEGYEVYTHWGTLSDVRYIVALGEKASKFLKNQKIPHYRLPHPSGKNRLLNDKNYIKQQLKECENYLTNESI